VLLRVSADDDRLRGGEEPQRLEHPLESLLRDHLADIREEGPIEGQPAEASRLFLRRQPLELAEVQAVRDHPRPIGPEAIGQGLRVRDDDALRQERDHRGARHDAGRGPVSHRDLEPGIGPQAHDPGFDAGQVRRGKRVVRIQGVEHVAGPAPRSQGPAQGPDSVREDQGAGDDDARFLGEAAMRAGGVEAHHLDLDGTPQNLEQLERLERDAPQLNPSPASVLSVPLPTRPRLRSLGIGRKHGLDGGT
jgi:hypothetical protein